MTKCSEEKDVFHRLFARACPIACSLRKMRAWLNMPLVAVIHLQWN